MKKALFALLPMLLVLGFVAHAQATQPAPELLPTAASVPGCDADAQLVDVDAQPLEWPLRVSFLETGLSCVSCQTHSECVSVCGVPWASCIPDFSCGGFNDKFCFCN